MPSLMPCCVQFSIAVFLFFQTTSETIYCVFQLGKVGRHYLDSTFNSLCIKLFKTGRIDVVKDCQSNFVIDLPGCVFKRRGINLYYEFTIYFYSEWFCQFCNKL